ncbi:GumC family protein [Novosphingobium malaysiense]|uniref:Lipopolysaccharide biosynthesis protein n=1 Tax=Novosphingobium malaysiense TaxID=1348853 RepID=A0A0B1ZUM9_9SPHN|nr:GNVR domain-containing protein [Novosphingobium malaysiense]KHK92878.1 hypothetical protein LK12_00210 [Novosphingobium malaysiense]
MSTNSLVPADARSRDIASLGDPVSNGRDRLDLDGSLVFFRRHAALILATMSAVLALALIGSLVMTKTYRAQARVMLTGNVSAAGQADPTQAGRAAISNQLVDTQVEIITSRDMVERVAKAMGLTDKRTPAEREALIDQLQSRVSAERSGESYAITISYDADTPASAMNIANAFAREYTQWELQLEQNQNSKTRKDVEAKLSRLRDQAQADTQALQNYRIANNLLSTSGTSLTEQEISNYEQQVAVAKAQASEDQARLNTALAQLRSGSDGDDVGEALNSSVVSNLRAQEAQLAGQVANLSSRYGDNHPELIRVRSQLSQVRNQIREEIARVISNLRAKADVSSQRLASLSATLGVARGKLSQNNEAMVGLSELQRNAEASQEIYETYLGSYKQLLAAEGSERPNARVLSWASLPSAPVSPNLKLNFALAIVVGLGLGVLAAYIVEALFQGLTTPEEVENLTGQHFLASIPLLTSIPSRGAGRSKAIATVRDEPYGVFTEAFRALGASIDQRTNGKAQVVAVTSALPDEGKTVISCCLSHVYAVSGMRTILIDCDLRRRGFSRLLGKESRGAGLLEVLNGSAQLNFDHNDNETVFWTLPIAGDDEDGDHLLTGKPFEDLIENLRTQFDRIVLDLPPVLPIAYTRVLAERADAVVVAARWRKTTAFALKAALRRLPSDQVHVAGVALSQVDLRQRAYFGKLDPAFYYKQYQKYYA